MTVQKLTGSNFDQRPEAVAVIDEAEITQRVKEAYRQGLQDGRETAFAEARELAETKLAEAIAQLLGDGDTLKQEFERQNKQVATQGALLIANSLLAFLPRINEAVSAAGMRSFIDYIEESLDSKMEVKFYCSSDLYTTRELWFHHANTSLIEDKALGKGEIKVLWDGGLASWSPQDVEDKIRDYLNHLLGELSK